jgi:3',5'-cyclic AMP phosphodiesterase CpdA
MSAPSPESLHSATCVIHTAYDAAAPPPKPSAAWTRFVCVSDSHGRTFAVPPGDVLLHAGDLTNTGRLAEMRTTVEWLRELAHTHKMLVVRRRSAAWLMRGQRHRG